MNRKIGLCVVAVLCWVLISSSVAPVQARPKYKTLFVELYAQDLANTDGFSRCTVCHSEAKKTVRNNYGDAVRETINEKGAKTDEAIEAALRATEDKPSAIDGKTFGDLIREGRLPASK